MNDELLIKYLLNESNSEENDEVRHWLALSQENATYLAQLERIWVESKTLGVKSEVDVNAAWSKFKSRANEVPTVKLKPLTTWMRIAAVFVVAIGSLGLYTVFKAGGYTDLNANNQVFSQVLPDGSELTLNRFSHIKFANNFKSNRSIQLDSGDVFFNVAKDKSKPFVIKIDKIAVEVVGTSFNIKHLKQQTEVVVESGIVKVSLGGSEVMLHKGEKVLIPKGATKLAKTLVNNQLYNYYRTNLFIADNTPLAVLAAVLSEAYGSTIEIDESVKDLTISTTLQYRKTLDENLEIIRGTLDKLKIKRNQNQIILSY